MSNSDRNIVVLGASQKPHRYAYMAISRLLENDFMVLPVHPKLNSVQGLPVISSLQDVKQEVDTLTLYLGPQRSLPLVDDIIALKPKRVIANPGTESDVLFEKLEKADIEVVEGCTLVMLRTGMF